MEITAQIARLDEEVKILKNEIKSILNEIRTAVLDRDNPFAPGASLPVFRPVERSEPSGAPEPEPEEAPEAPLMAPASVRQEDRLPHVLRVDPTEGVPEAGGTPEGPLSHVRPVEPAAAPPDGWRGPPKEGSGAKGEAVAGHAWSVAAIANLVAWVDETTSRLGPTHLHMIIDLARFAGLLPQEAEETLLKVIKLASSRKDSTTASVNDILVALRQLEAIFQGAEADDLSISLRRQSAGRTR